MRRSAAGPAAILLLALVTGYRIWLLERIPDQGSFTKYPALAERILAGSIPTDRLADVSPAYLWFSVAARGLGADYRATRAFQVLLTGLAALAIGALAWRRGGPLPGAAAGAALLASRSALINAAELEPESLILFCNAAALSLAAWRPAGRGTLAAAGLCAGLSIAARPSGLLFALVLAAFLLWERTPPRPLLLFSGSVLAPPLAVLILHALLIGTPSLMNPGTVFYEGNHPGAGGYSAAIPLLVRDYEGCVDEPDALHQGYRLLAGRAAGAATASPETTNEYWTGLALRWIGDDPEGAGSLVAAKLLGSVGSYETWDLITLERKSRQIPIGPWLPFGALVAIALAAPFVARDRLTVLAASLVVSGLAVTTVFYVSARQRNAIVPAASLLAGWAIAAAIRRWREGERARVGIAAAIAIVATALLHPLPARAREHRYLWDVRLGAFPAASLLGEAAPPVEALQRAASDPLRGDRSEPLTFDLATRLIEQGRSDMAVAMLGALEGYRPERDGAEPSSVAYQVARARLRLGQREAAEAALRKALEEAPGDPFVLTLAAELGMKVPSAARTSDPFTVRLALARARVDVDDRDEAARDLLRLRQDLPEMRCAFGRWVRRAGFPPMRSPTL